MDALEIIIIVTGLIGQALVAKRIKWGFVFWIIGNLALSIVFWQSQKFGLIGLHAIYTSIQIYSFVNWARLDKKAHRMPATATVGAERRDTNH